ncbi:hypothetical protein DFH06DRAFT_1279179 [Mycena polygramma]|nr:hypothetical protein DFH06DRAFT_1279179 [Mycena polygramma]
MSQLPAQARRHSARRPSRSFANQLHCLTTRVALRSRQNRGEQPLKGLSEPFISHLSAGPRPLIMVDWKSGAEITEDAAVYGKFMYALIGLYIWEWLTSLDFDWEYLLGKRQFRWPMIFYFLNRYCLLFALIAIFLNVTTEIDCQALYTFNQCFGNPAIGLASINLSIRTVAVWNRPWFICVPLVAVIFGHWSLLLHGVLLKAVWIPDHGCVLTSTNTHLLVITYIYSMIFDFTIMCLTAYKLVSPMGTKSRLARLIFNDGLIYFAIAFLSNLLANIFMLLALNPVMSIIANAPTAVAPTIVACRAVRRLKHYGRNDAQTCDDGAPSRRKRTFKSQCSGTVLARDPRFSALPAHILHSGGHNILATATSSITLSNVQMHGTSRNNETGYPAHDS